MGKFIILFMNPLSLIHSLYIILAAIVWLPDHIELVSVSGMSGSVSLTWVSIPKRDFPFLYNYDRTVYLFTHCLNPHVE